MHGRPLYFSARLLYHPHWITLVIYGDVVIKMTCAAQGAVYLTRFFCSYILLVAG